MTAVQATFDIHPAALADPATLSAIAGVEAAAFPEPWTSQALAELQFDPGMLAWAAESPAGVVVGYALLRVVPAAAEAELLRVATTPAWQRLGVANGLLKAACAELDRSSFDCFLEVRADNRPAQLLYERHAFAYLDRRPAYYRDGCAAWIYARRPAGSG